MGNEYQEMRKTQKYRVRNVQALQRRNILKKIQDNRFKMAMEEHFFFF